jgi:hypothetical protein
MAQLEWSVQRNETKLADRFSTQRTAGMSGDSYRELAADCCRAT